MSSNWNLSVVVILTEFNNMFDYGENMTDDQVFLLISNRASKIMVAFMAVFLQIHSIHLDSASGDACGYE